MARGLLSLFGVAGSKHQGYSPDIDLLKETAMELSSDSVERKANQAHLAVDSAAAKATERAAPAIDRAAQAAHQTVDKVAQAAAPAADWINQNAEQLKQQQEALLEGCRSYVRDRPLVAVGVALAAGYLVGRLAR
jgi:ElaB/YqjD/DUF883 family membrane-anchored ribosome-binding protein